jgi:hypothetical protein
MVFIDSVMNIGNGVNIYANSDAFGQDAHLAWGEIKVNIWRGVHTGPTLTVLLVPYVSEAPKEVIWTETPGPDDTIVIFYTGDGAERRVAEIQHPQSLPWASEYPLKLYLNTTPDLRGYWAVRPETTEIDQWDQDAIINNTVPAEALM